MPAPRRPPRHPLSLSLSLSLSVRRHRASGRRGEAASAADCAEFFPGGRRASSAPPPHRATCCSWRAPWPLPQCPAAHLRRPALSRARRRPGLAGAPRWPAFLLSAGDAPAQGAFHSSPRGKGQLGARASAVP
jgi:hypothetical protein